MQSSAMQHSRMRAADTAARTGVRRKHRLKCVEKVRPAVEAPHGKPREHTHDCGHESSLIGCKRRGQRQGVTRDSTFSSTHQPLRNDAATSAVTRLTSVSFGVPGMRNHTVLGAAGWPGMGGTEPRVSTSTQLHDRREHAHQCSGLGGRAPRGTHNGAMILAPGMGKGIETGGETRQGRVYVSWNG